MPTWMDARVSFFTLAPESVGLFPIYAYDVVYSRGDSVELPRYVSNVGRGGRMVSRPAANALSKEVPQKRADVQHQHRHHHTDGMAKRTLSIAFFLTILILA